MTDRLIVDIYEGDGDFDVKKLHDAGSGWIGVMLKVSQGTYYSAPAWLGKIWPRMQTCERYGASWFRIPYAYLDVGIDGVLQADFAMRQVELAGGLGKGDPFFVIDVERGGQRVAITKQRIIDVGAACVERLRSLTGKDVVCYGGQLLRETGVVLDDLKCDLGWVADYDALLPPIVYESIGCPLPHLFAWQYAGANGDGSESAKLVGYPHTTPAGNADISAVLLNGGGDHSVDALARMCA